LNVILYYGAKRCEVSDLKKKTITYVILAAALFFIIVGAAQGDYMDTLHKATIICLECIGIG